ncbi:MAG: hypothetical protein MI975_24610 [Cytophagales bacterium]|nr:hypothetical protein [Cytophagales bacterium]
MNFLNNRTFLKDILKQADVMNTVNGGVRQTEYSVQKMGNDVLIKISNPSVSLESFNFTINKDELFINIMHVEKSSAHDQLLMYPLFFKVVVIPYYVDINRIEATYESGIFKILLPYNNNLPKRPFKVKVKNRDN